MKAKQKSLLFVLSGYTMISIIMYYKLILNSGIVLDGSGSFAPSLNIFYKEVVFSPVWSEILSKSVKGTWIYSPHWIFYIVGKFLKFTPQRVIMLEYITFSTISGVTMYYLAKYIFNNGNNKRDRDKDHLTHEISAFVAGIIYMANLSYRLGDANYIGIQFSYSIFPLVVLYFMKAFYEQKMRHILAFAFFWAEAATFDQRYVISPLLVIIPHVGLIALINKSIKTLKHAIILIAKGVVIFWLIGGYYLLNITSTATTGVYTALTNEAVKVTWSNGNIINLLRAASHFQLPKYIHIVPFGVTKNLVIPMGIIIVALSFVPLIRLKKNVMVLFYSTILLLLVGLFSGFGMLSKHFLYWLVLKSPMNNFIGRLFRTTRIVDQITSVSLSILFGFFTLNIVSNLNDHQIVVDKKGLKFMIGVLISIMIFIAYEPVFTGNMAGRLGPFKIPEGYKKINDMLESQESKYKILCTPEFWGPYQPYWSKGNPVDALTYYGFASPTYYARNDILTPFYAYTVSYKYNSLLKRAKFKELDRFLGSINIGYIVLHNDIQQFSWIVNSSIKNLSKSPYFRIIKTAPPVYLIEIKNPSSQVYISAPPTIVYGGFETGTNLLDIVPNQSIIFGDELNTNLNSIKYSTNIVVTNYKNIMDIMVSVIPPKYRIDPSHYTVYYQPNRWSRAYITDPHHGIWHSFINQFPNQKWEFSYGISTGFAFIVYGNDTLEIPVKIKNNSNYQMFIRILKSTKGGNVQVTIDNLSRTINTKDLTKAEFVWVNLGEIYLKKGDYILKIKNIYGSNAINLIVIIPSKKFAEIENKVKNILSKKHIIYIVNGKEDIYYNPEGVGIFKLNLIKSGTYKLAVNSTYPVNITIDNTTVQVRDRIKNLFYSKPIYIPSKQIFIKMPTHTNLIKNPSFEEGLEYWSKPKQGFYVKIDNSTSYYGKYSLEVITNKTKKDWSWIYQEVNVQPNTEYIIETHIKYKNVEESHIAIDVYNTKTKSWKRIGALPSAREGTSDWQTFKMILKTNPYITKIRIVLNAGWVKDPSKGSAITWFDGIMVYKSAKKTQSIVIFPVSKANETLNDLFKTNETPATVQNYTKINPTLWKVEVNATKPFFLTFAESYDPLWEARVYKDGKLVERVHPVPVYGVINGFWINQTGNLEIVLRYTPQDWFERGLIISLTTFIMSILYLFYDWRREKGDRWAKRLEKKIKDITTSLKSRIRGVLRR